MGCQRYHPPKIQSYSQREPKERKTQITPLRTGNSRYDPTCTWRATHISVRPYFGGPQPDGCADYICKNLTTSVPQARSKPRQAPPKQKKTNTPRFLAEKEPYIRAPTDLRLSKQNRIFKFQRTEHAAFQHLFILCLRTVVLETVYKDGKILHRQPRITIAVMRVVCIFSYVLDLLEPN